MGKILDVNDVGFRADGIMKMEWDEMRPIEQNEAKQKKNNIYQFQKWS